jgi:hypothetical protein
MKVAGFEVNAYRVESEEDLSFVCIHPTWNPVGSLCVIDWSEIFTDGVFEYCKIPVGPPHVLVAPPHLPRFSSDEPAHREPVGATSTRSFQA